MEEMRNF